MQQGWGAPWGCRSRFPHYDPTELKELGFFLVRFSTEAGESILFLSAQALDSSTVGVPLIPHQLLSIGVHGGVLTLCCGEEQNRQSWKPWSLSYSPGLC